MRVCADDDQLQDGTCAIRHEVVIPII
jgi:hypothetical protein